MEILKLVILASAIVALPSAKPIASTRAAEIIEAKASLREAADAAFNSIWQKAMTEEGPRPSATQTRQFAYWMTPAFSLGMCRSRDDTSALADWYSKLDAVDFSYSDDPANERAKAMKEGKKLYENGVEEGGTDTFCSVEMPAIAEYLREF